MSVAIALIANLFMKRGPFVLSQTQSDQKLYYRGERLQDYNFVGVRPSPVFTMVNKLEDATRYNWWLTAWHYRQALHRSSEHASAISIEPLGGFKP